MTTIQFWFQYFRGFESTVGWSENGRKKFFFEFQLASYVKMC